jgi:hypothetical protein
MGIEFVVVNEHTLGSRRTEAALWLKPLAFREGGYSPEKGLAIISPRDRVRSATKKDFELFGLDPSDYLEL